MTLPTQPAKAPTPVLIASMGTCAQANTAWNTRKRIAASIKGPTTGCSTTASSLSLTVTPSSARAAHDAENAANLGLIEFEIRGGGRAPRGARRERREQRR